MCMPTVNSPVQLINPSPVYPTLHMQSNDPTVLVQVASLWQRGGLSAHSFLSESVENNK